MLMWLILGFVCGWWSKAVYYKLNRLLKTSWEWASDRINCEKWGISQEEMIDAIKNGKVVFRDANIPWWFP